MIEKFSPGDIVLVKEASPYSEDLVIIERPYIIVGGVTISQPRMEITIGQAESLLLNDEITKIYKNKDSININ